MPICTGLAPDPRRPGYRVVEVDRGRFASLPDDALRPLALVVGAEITPEIRGTLDTLAEVEGAYQAAVRLERLRSHAKRDLRRRLLQKQHRGEVVDQAIARLEWTGIIDDRRFAETFARAKLARGRGPSRVLRDLLTQGVDRRLAEQAVAAGVEQEGVDPARAARTAAERRVKQLTDLPPATKRRRLMAYLARRGFGGSETRDLVRELCGS
ncbi:MAG TPA: regulatory protein RecX [Gemmatimonadales bacterium]|nr:regulatory protein RecX [Gemmatimonadales bacterium]